jgi:hypothetical protein
MTMKIGVLWDGKCSLGDVYRCFGGLCFLHIQDKSLDGDKDWIDPVDSKYYASYFYLMTEAEPASDTDIIVTCISDCRRVWIGKRIYWIF